jgi:hypothetical protein
MTATTLIADAASILQMRGRCRGNFVLGDGTLDPLGAIAVAAGLEPDTWMGLREIPESQIYGVDRAMVNAAWVLATVAVPRVDTPLMPVHDLVGVLGNWADVATDAEIFDALAKAAHVAAQACEGSVRHG